MVGRRVTPRRACGRPGAAGCGAQPPAGALTSAGEVEEYLQPAVDSVAELWRSTPRAPARRSSTTAPTPWRQRPANQRCATGIEPGAGCGQPAGLPVSRGRRGRGRAGAEAGAQLLQHRRRTARRRRRRTGPAVRRRARIHRAHRAPARPPGRRDGPAAGSPGQPVHHRPGPRRADGPEPLHPGRGVRHPAPRLAEPQTSRCATSLPPSSTVSPVTRPNRLRRSADPRTIGNRPAARPHLERSKAADPPRCTPPLPYSGRAPPRQVATGISASSRAISVPFFHLFFPSTRPALGATWATPADRCPARPTPTWVEGEPALVGLRHEPCGGRAAERGAVGGRGRQQRLYRNPPRFVQGRAGGLRVVAEQVAQLPTEAHPARCASEKSRSPGPWLSVRTGLRDQRQTPAVGPACPRGPPRAGPRLDGGRGQEHPVRGQGQRPARCDQGGGGQAGDQQGSADRRRGSQGGVERRGALRAEPKLARPNRSRAGMDISSPTRLTVLPKKYDVPPATCSHPWQVTSRAAARGSRRGARGQVPQSEPLTCGDCDDRAVLER